MLKKLFQLHPKIGLNTPQIYHCYWFTYCTISVIGAKMVLSVAVYQLKIDDYNVRTFALHTDGHSRTNGLKNRLKEYVKK